MYCNQRVIEIENKPDNPRLMNKGILHRMRLLACIFLLLWTSCQTKEKQWTARKPEKVDTRTRPVQYQLKKTYAVGGGIYLSNDFDGARMNGVARTGAQEITVLITPENTPINHSPWYAFKIWADKPQNIQLKLSYSEGVSHRYHPKTSKDGILWTPIDSVCFQQPDSSKKQNKPSCAVFKVALNRDTTWLAAQEVISSTDTRRWARQLATKPDVSMEVLGESYKGRAIDLLQIGNPNSDSLILILSRQHPPEVTGWLAMKAFVETLCAATDSSALFRSNYCTYVVPCMNPDGVDLGHWRHSAAGVDLNRDWEDFNQPETQAVRKMMQHKILRGKKFYLAIDFHSTDHDCYYTISPDKEGNMPGLVPEIIEAVARELPDYQPDVRPIKTAAAKFTSDESIFHSFHAEALTYEVGDNTPRDFIETKGMLFAKITMKKMLARRSEETDAKNKVATETR